MQPLDLSDLLNCCDPLKMVQTEKNTLGHQQHNCTFKF